MHKHTGPSEEVTRTWVMDSEKIARLISDRLEAPPQRLLVVSDFDGTISEVVHDSGRARRLLPGAGEAIQRRGCSASW